MARTRQRDAPAGALSDDDLQQWLTRSRAQLGDQGISAVFGRGPRAGGAPGPTWVTMTATNAYGRLVRWADGVATVTAHPLSGGPALLDERHPHTTIAQLEALVAALSTARPSAAGRA